VLGDKWFLMAGLACVESVVEKMMLRQDLSGYWG
jgi:hypothetical protein